MSAGFRTVTITGVMDFASLMGTPHIKVQQDKPGERITCNFNPVTQMDVIDGLGKRVDVTGTAAIGRRGEVLRLIAIDDVVIGSVVSEGGNGA